MEETIDRAISRTIRAKQRFPFALLSVLIPLAILLPHQIWNSLILAIGGIYGLSAAWIFSIRHHIDAKRERKQQWLSVGDELIEQFQISNLSFLPTTWIELEDESNVPGYRPSVAYQLLPQESVSWRQSALCLQRGHFFVGPWRLRTGDPFGFFELIIEYGIEDDLLIYPPITTEIPFGLPAGLQHGQTAGPEMVRHMTQNVSTVREYRRGDPMRWIHWPTTARRGKLAVREFDIDAAGDIWILLDVHKTNHIGEGDSGTEEQAILIASALVAQGLASNRTVGIAMYGRAPTLIHPLKGVDQQWKLLYALAVADIDGELTLSESVADLKSIIHRGSALIVITPHFEADLQAEYADLASKEVRVTTILFDRASYGEEKLGLPQFPSRLNHTLFTIHQGEITSPISEAAGGFEYRVTPMGSVIRVEKST